MADVSITRISTKGQIVIPNDMRQGFKSGEKLLIIRNNNQFIIKKAGDIDMSIADDIKFAKKTEDAWKLYRKSGFRNMSSEEFLKRLSKC